MKHLRGKMGIFGFTIFMIAAVVAFILICEILTPFLNYIIWGIEHP